MSVVTKLLAWDCNCYHFFTSLSNSLLSPLLLDETILTSTAWNSYSQKAELSSVFTVKLVECVEMVNNLKLWPVMLSLSHGNKMGLLGATAQ